MKFPKIFKKGSKHIDSTTGRGFFRRIAHDAFVDWTLSIVISTIFTGSLVAIGLSMYMNMDATISAQATATASKAASSASVDTHTLDAVLDLFDGRTALRAQLLRGYSGPGDPSL